jgi:hypothetical protein
MKKYIIILLSFLCLSISLTGCRREQPQEIGITGEDVQINDDNLLTNSVNNAEPTPTPIPIDHETIEPPIPGMIRSRITNEWVPFEIGSTRPIAIIIPNSRTASQFGISRADVLYECNVEGSMTRLMGIWGDWSGLDKIGNIRSTRDYFVYWTFEWDAIFIHYGGPFYSDEILSKATTENIDLLKYVSGSYRDTAKNTTDNAFTSTDLILRAIDYHKYPIGYQDGLESQPHFNFAEPKRPNTLSQYNSAINAKTIDMSPTFPVTNCYFKFNAATGLYERFQHLAGETDGPHLDMMNGEQLTFKNIIVQNTYFEQRDQQGYLAFQCHDNTRGGWYFTNGKGIRITWEKNRDYDATRYYDENGNEVVINTGKTMILIIQDGDPFLVDGVRVK